MTSVEEPRINDPRSDVAQPAPEPRLDNRHYSALWQIIVTRVKEFFRHPSAIFWVYIFPVLMAIVLGMAFENPNAETFIVDVQSAPGAALIVSALGKTRPEIVIRTRSVDEATARMNLKTGRTMLVVVPKSTDGVAGVGPSLDALQVEYLFDATRQDSVAARRTVDDVLQRAAGRQDAIAIEDVRYREIGGRYIDFLVPGLIGAGLMSAGMWGVGFVVVDLRVRHLLKRFVTTPMNKAEFLAGLILSRFFFMMTEVALMLIAVWWLFDIHVRGSWLAFSIFIFLGAWVFAGMGLVVASRTMTLETASGIINLVMLPLWMISGIFFQSERFGEAVQPLIRLTPLAALIEGLRAIMIEGAGMGPSLYYMGVLLVWAVVCFVASLKLFRWY
jgi:ABC-type polysaccharide/polyol phosphate export permease